MREKIKISAMRERDMRAFLADHGLVKEIDLSEAECAYCGTVLSWDNLGGVLVKDGAPVLVCVATECIEHAQRGNADG